jgi:hypothetical protein
MSDYKNALRIAPMGRAECAERALLRTDDAEIVRAWICEAEDRIKAYERGEIKAVTLDEVFSRFAKNQF